MRMYASRPAAPGCTTSPTAAGAGRYQFLVDAGSYIQKTVEGAGSVRYYLAAGVHELSIVQDPGKASTDWSVSLKAAGVANDSLPYSKLGGQLGGSNNPFGRERLPLQVLSGGTANFRLKLTGNSQAGLAVQLTPGLAGTAVYTTPVVYGGETFWWTADLAAGLNQIQLLAQTANTTALQYELTVDGVPPAPFGWTGIAASRGGNSVAKVQLASAGAYHVKLTTPKGFAQVLLDQAAPVPGGTLPTPVQATQGHVAEFDVPLSVGAHNFLVRQSPSYITTTWSLSVTATVAGPTLAHFSGGLEAGAKIDPQLPLFGTQDQEVNFQVKVPAGTGQMAVTIANPAGGTAFSGVARAGETLWGTAKIKPGQNTFTFQNTGSATLSYDVTVYAVGGAPYDWAGVSQGAGTWNSQIKLNFPQSGLYSFTLDRTAGRYQFLLDDNYIQKTVEAKGTVSYYVPAGIHVLKVDQDSAAAGTTWAVSILAPGAAEDALPYSKLGGQIGGSGNDFSQEWLPVKLGAATPANFKLTLTGGRRPMRPRSTCTAGRRASPATAWPRCGAARPCGGRAICRRGSAGCNWWPRRATPTPCSTSSPSTAWRPCPARRPRPGWAARRVRRPTMRMCASRPVAPGCTTSPTRRGRALPVPGGWGPLYPEDGRGGGQRALLPAGRGA